MAAITNTYTSNSSVRNRETFSDLISMITPEETPFTSLIGTESVDGVKPEWQTDALATPSTSNAYAQGEQFTYAAITPTTRVGNHTQIFRKDFIIANTQEVVSKAGPKSDYNREKLKKGLELKIDVEVTAVYNQAAVAASGATAGKMAGLRPWCMTNDLMGTSGASGSYTSGVVATAATNGTQRAFTKALLDAGIQAAYNAGGNPTICMVSPYVKTVFSTFMSDANVVANRGKVSGDSQARIYAAADEYLSDFGLISVMPNRQWARAGATVARNAFLLEPGKLAMGVLRPIKEAEVVPNADAKPGVLITETTLIVRNEAALACIADLFGLTASS